MITAAELEQRIQITLTGAKRFVGVEWPDSPVIPEVVDSTGDTCRTARACLDLKARFTSNDVHDMLPWIQLKKIAQYMSAFSKRGLVKSIGHYRPPQGGRSSNLYVIDEQAMERYIAEAEQRLARGAA